MPWVTIDQPVHLSLSLCSQDVAPPRIPRASTAQVRKPTKTRVREMRGSHVLGLPSSHGHVRSSRPSVPDRSTGQQWVAEGAQWAVPGPSDGAGRRLRVAIGGGKRPMTRSGDLCLSIVYLVDFELEKTAGGNSL